MIEILKSKKGLEIFKYNGRTLASTYDPEVEALKWVKKNRSLIRGVRNVFVLGVGSAYHLIALRNAYPCLGIHVFDPREDLIAEIKKRWSMDIMEIQFIHSIDDIIDRCLATSFVSLRHIPSWYGCEKQFFEIEQYLTGRFDLGFQRQLELREELNSLLDEKKLLNADEKTIHDLLNSIKPEVKNKVALNHLLTVAELVK